MMAKEYQCLADYGGAVRLERFVDVDGVIPARKAHDAPSDTPISWDQATHYFADAQGVRRLVYLK